MNKIFKIALAVSASILALGLQSCSDDNRIFDQTASERTDQVLTKTSSILRSATNGWEMRFYPSEKMSYGGFTALVRFGADGTLVAASEVSRDDAGTYPTATSYYQIDGSAGPTLSFSTYNHAIHLFSEPNTPYNEFSGAPINTGAAGDFNFQIVSASSERVVLRGIRSDVYAELTPLPADTDWQTYLGKIRQSLRDNNYFLFQVGSATGQMKNRHLYLTVDGQEQSYPFRPTATGIELYEEVTIQGERVRTFVAGGTSDAPTLQSGNVVLKAVAPDLSNVLQTQTWFFNAQTATGRAQNYLRLSKSTIERAGSRFSAQVRYFALLMRSGTPTVLTGIRFTFDDGPATLNGAVPMKITRVSDTEVAIQIDEAAYAAIAENTNNGAIVKRFGAVLTAGAFANVKDFRGQTIDGNFTERTFTIEPNNKFNPTELKLVDKSDTSSTITLSLDFVGI